MDQKMEIQGKIIEGAGKLFREHGIKQVTMDAIAQSLGISKRTIYENFKDKSELLTVFLKESIIEHKKKVFEIMARADNVIDALFEFGEYNQVMMKSVNPCFISDIKKYHPEVFKNVVDSGEVRNYEISYMIIKRGVDEEIFSNEIDIDIVNLFIHHMMEFFQKAEDRKFEHFQIIKSVHLPYLKGICTEKGLRLLNSILIKLENSDSN